MIECPNCGSLNLEGNNFCGKCGTRLPAPKICPECQLQSFYNDFCTNCGTKLVSQSDFEKIKLLMDEAFDLWIFDRKYDQAIRKYDMVLQIYPNSIKALQNKGACLSSLNKYDDAINCFNEILLKIDSNNLSALNSKGNCFKSQYKYINAIDCYNKALRIDPNYKSSLKSKARVLVSMKKYDELPDILPKIHPERTYEWVDLSDMYLKINDFDNSLKCLDNIDDEDKDYFYRKKSEIFQQLGKYDVILEKCNEKLKKDSSNHLALKLKANCLTSLKKYDEAINCLDKLIELNSNDNVANFDKVRILLKLKKYEDIKSILSKIKPEEYFDYRLLSKYYMEINELDESLKCLNKYIKNLPFFNSYVVVDIYLKLDKPERALEYCNKALENNPNDYYALWSKGKYYEFKSDFDKAIEFYNKAISINKYDNTAYFSKIDLLLKQEKYSEAKRVLLNMKHENSYNYWNQLSKYYIKLNDYDNALECIDKTINLNYNIEYLVKKGGILHELERYDDAMEVCKEASKLNSEYDKLIELLNKIKSSGD